MANEQAVEVPQTLEGWFLLHDVYTLDWKAWRGLTDVDRERVVSQAGGWLACHAAVEKGDSAAYSVLTQKGDLMFVHYRESPDALAEVELSLRSIELSDYLRPSYSYFSVIELSMYELQAIVAMRLREAGVEHGTAEHEAAHEKEYAKQRERMNGRLYRDIPGGAYICFYPMSKRRGEHVNWYAMSMDERRKMMRGHAGIGHKYHDTVTQIIAGSVGLDDWEWGVSLHADDMIVFKKLIYEMRFDPASSLFAEFGPFYLGIRRSPDQLAAALGAGPRRS